MSEKCTLIFSILNGMSEKIMKIYEDSPKVCLLKSLRRDSLQLRQGRESKRKMLRKEHHTRLFYKQVFCPSSQMRKVFLYSRCLTWAASWCFQFPQLDIEFTGSRGKLDIRSFIWNHDMKFSMEIHPIFISLVTHRRKVAPECKRSLLYLGFSFYQPY